MLPVAVDFTFCLCASTQVYVLKRPHVDEFLKRMGEMFECVLFTASLAKVRPLFLSLGHHLLKFDCKLQDEQYIRQEHKIDLSVQLLFRWRYVWSYW